MLLANSEASDDRKPHIKFETNLRQPHDCRGTPLIHSPLTHSRNMAEMLRRRPSPTPLLITASLAYQLRIIILTSGTTSTGLRGEESTNATPLHLILWPHYAFFIDCLTPYPISPNISNMFGMPQAHCNWLAFVVHLTTKSLLLPPIASTNSESVTASSRCNEINRTRTSGPRTTDTAPTNTLRSA